MFDVNYRKTREINNSCSWLFSTKNFWLLYTHEVIEGASPIFFIKWYHEMSVFHENHFESPMVIGTLKQSPLKL